MCAHNFFLNSWRTLTVPMLVTILVGCTHKDNRVATFQVSGNVTIDGKPLSLGLVILEPVADGRSAKGSIRANGSFSLGTYEENDGVVPGRYRIAILPRKNPEQKLVSVLEMPMVEKSPIPERYCDTRTSGLTFEVTSGSNALNIALSSSQPSR